MPDSRENLGALAERESRIVPIAFHVDYFNDPWKDVFSDPLYSQRQMAYNELYTKPKNQEYGLYYTPMLMIDGRQSVNGRDPASAEAAIRQALARKPAVGLDVALDVGSDGRSGTATIKVTSRSARCREVAAPGLRRAPRGRRRYRLSSQAKTRGKSLVARFPARQTKYEFIELDGKSPATKAFTFAIEPSWNRQNLRLAAVRSGQAHRRHPPGDRSPLAFDPTRRDIDDQRSQRDAPDTLKGALMLSPIRSMALAAAVVLLAAPTAFSQGKGKPAPDEQTGLKVGEKAPKFTLKDQEGKERSLDDLLKKGKVALVFYRSADW